MTRLITYSGRLLDLLHPSSEDILIEDIAHQLALTNRWAGASRFPISVAQHSLLVSREVELLYPSNHDAILWGLFHDAAEAYIGDLPSPVKAFCGTFVMQEKVILQRVSEAFNLPEIDPVNLYPYEVMLADRRVAAKEAREMLPVDSYLCTAYEETVPSKQEIVEMSWRTARNLFIARFDDLRRRDGTKEEAECA